MMAAPRATTSAGASHRPIAGNKVLEGLYESWGESMPGQDIMNRARAKHVRPKHRPASSLGAKRLQRGAKRRSAARDRAGSRASQGGFSERRGAERPSGEVGGQANRTKPEGS